MKYVKFWAPAIIWMSLIFYFSSRSRFEVSDIYAIQFLFFKTLHIVEYAYLYVFLYRGFKNTTAVPEWEQRFNAFLGAVLYGILDEIHQVFVPTREGRMRDIVIDTIGVTIAALYLWKYLPKAPKILKSWAKKWQLI